MQRMRRCQQNGVDRGIGEDSVKIVGQCELMFGTKLSRSLEIGLHGADNPQPFLAARGLDEIAAPAAETDDRGIDHPMAPDWRDSYGQTDPVQDYIGHSARHRPIEPLGIWPYKRMANKARAGSEDVDTNELYARGLRRRKKLFGEAEVEKRMGAAGEFGAPLQNIINAYVYGDIWERSGLSDNIRRLVMLGITAAGNKPAEFRVHAKGALANGCTREQVQDVLLLVAMYCGIPAAIETNRIAAEIFGETQDPALSPPAKP